MSQMQDIVELFDRNKKNEFQSDNLLKHGIQSVQTMMFPESMQFDAFGGDMGSYQELRYNMKRGFMKNTSGSDVTIKFNGRNWTFTNSDPQKRSYIYCLDIQEKSFFMSKAHEQGTTLVDATPAEWLAGGVVQTYYW